MQVRARSLRRALPRGKLPQAARHPVEQVRAVVAHRVAVAARAAVIVLVAVVDTAQAAEVAVAVAAGRVAAVGVRVGSAVADLAGGASAMCLDAGPVASAWTRSSILTTRI